MDNFPKLRMLIGIPGSGKTTYCEDFIKQDFTHRTVHISSDLIRKELFEDASNQSNNELVFNTMHERTLSYLEKGCSVLYDATNITRKDRLGILKKVPNYVIKEAIICWAPIEECIARDSNRICSVGTGVIDKMLKKFQAPYFDEGFDRIYLVKPDNFDALAYLKRFTHYDNISQDTPYHQLTLKEHMYASYLYLKDQEVIDSDLRCAASWHDIGKLYTKTFTNSKGEVSDIAHYYGHQGYSAWIGYGFNASNNHIAWLVSNHMEPYFNSKYYKQLPSFLCGQLDILHEADKAAH